MADTETRDPLVGWCNFHQNTTCGGGGGPNRHNHLEVPYDWWAENPDAWVVLVPTEPT